MPNDNEENVNSVATPNDSVEITPEIQKIIDRRVTEASKTAYNNAYEKLQKDASFIDSIKTQLEEEAKLSAEEKLAVERKKLEADKLANACARNELLVAKKLAPLGLDDDTTNFLIKTLVTSDEKATTTKTDSFVEMLEKIVSAKVESEMKATANNITKPNTGGEGITKKESLELAYKEASKNGDELKMLSLINEASKLGIQLI